MIRKCVAILGLVILAVFGPLSLVVAQHSSTPVAAEGDFAGLVDIGGRKLYLECRGAGSPTVILEAGFRTRADVWSDDLVQPENPRTTVLPGWPNSPASVPTIGPARRR